MFHKKVLHLYSSRTAGGAEKLMISLAQALQKQGLDNVIGCPKNSYMYNKAKELGLIVYPISIKGSFDPIGIFQLAGVINKEKIEIIHAHQGKVFWPCIIMKFLLKPKVVFHRHAHIPHRFYSRTHYKFADKVIAISNIVKNGLRQSENVAEHKLRVVYNGTDFNRFNKDVSNQEIRDKYNLRDKKVIGTVGAMNKPKGKGQQYLIETAQFLKDKFPDNRYLIVGTGPLLNNLMKMAKDMKVEDIVIFTGYQERIENYIAAMDIFCFLSWDREGFGQVMVEAQGMGKPVIGTNVGGIPETFKSGQTGVLIDPENPHMLAEAIKKMLDNEANMQSMGQKGLKFVNEKFSINEMAKNTIDVYKEMYQ